VPRSAVNGTLRHAPNINATGKIQAGFCRRLECWMTRNGWTVLAGKIGIRPQLNIILHVNMNVAFAPAIICAHLFAPTIRSNAMRSYCV
jgi:hypothetical protein